MFGKIVLLCFLAIHVQALPNTNFENPDDLIQPILDQIQHAIKILQEAINRIENELPDLLKNLTQKIAEIYLQLDLNKIIENIIDEINSEISNRENVITCIETEVPKIRALAIKEHEALKKCVQEAETKVQVLKQEAANIVKEAKNLIENAKDGLAKCLKNPVTALHCLKDLWENLTTQSEKIHQDVQKLIEDAKKIVPVVQEELQVCVQAIIEDAKVEFKAIVDEIKTCVDS